MLRPIIKCPFCAAALPNMQFRATAPLTCPGCGRQLQISRWYSWLTLLFSFAVTFAICFLIGLRGWRLAGIFLVIWFPVDVLSMFPFVRVFPPQFELWREKTQNDGENLFPPSITR